MPVKSKTKAKPAAAKKANAPTATLVTFLLDATQSMQKIKSVTLESFNDYVNELKASAAKIDFSLITFNKSEIKKVWFETPIKDVPELDAKTYDPKNWTPLIEAATKTIKALEKAIEKKSTKPKVVVCIQTDGEENSSGSEYSWASLKSLIEEKKKQGWQFTFLGAGIDAYDQGARMGMATADTMSYDHTDKGATRAAFVASALNTASFAAGLRTNTSYSGAQKLASKDNFDPTNKKHSPFVRPTVYPFATPHVGWDHEVLIATSVPDLDLTTTIGKPLKKDDDLVL